MRATRTINSSTTGHVASIGVRTMLAVCLLGSSCLAQLKTPYNSATTFDAYGNARPIDVRRRVTGSFQSSLQRQALRGFQNLDRRIDRRGGASGFTLPGDLFLIARTRTLTRLSPSLDPMRPRLSQQEAFDRYGGYGKRIATASRGDVQEILTRRSSLLAATALNAPVHRAAMNYGTGISLRAAVEQTPFVRQDASQGSEEPIQLSEWLRMDADRACERVRREAWSWFGDGAYRRALRAFEAVGSLDPEDGEARIGKIFCHVTLGAARTALAVFDQLTRRVENPFLYDLDVAAAYGNASDVRRARVQAEWRSQSETANSKLRAMRVLVLWYLGERDEASRAVSALVTDDPDGAYSGWPAMINLARSASPGDTRTLAP